MRGTTKIISIIGVANCAHVMLKPTGLNLKYFNQSTEVKMVCTLNDKTNEQIDKHNHE